MKRSLLVLSLLFYCFMLFGQPVEGDPGYDPCNDPDIPPDESCFYEDPNLPLDRGVPILIAFGVVIAIRNLNSNK